MTLARFLTELRACPIVASVQASDDSPLEDSEVLAKLALASANEGVRILRAQGVENIRAIRDATGLPVIGLIKRRYEGSEVYITPTLGEVRELIETGCEAIALDATSRGRPGGETLAHLVAAAKAGGMLVVGDCDTSSSVRNAVESGCDVVSTTLSGYTADSPASDVPDLDFVWRAVQAAGIPVLAEGRLTNPRQAHTALRCGAVGVVVGGALNDAVKQTRWFVSSLDPCSGLVAAVDIGGTWLRFGLFSNDWNLLEVDRVPLPAGRDERLSWIHDRVGASGAVRLGVATGGIVEPATGTVILAKPSIPNHVGTRFSDLGVSCLALNDGLASAWGHACLPEFAGMRVATLALGTGVGFGFAFDAKLWMGKHGQPPILSDLDTGEGRTIEQLLGGAKLTDEPSDDARAAATRAARQAVTLVCALLQPDVVVLCGSVGMAEWLELKSLLPEPERFADNPSEALRWSWPSVVRSAFGADAGLYGAAALALFPPPDLAHRLRA